MSERKELKRNGMKHKSLKEQPKTKKILHICKLFKNKIGNFGQAFVCRLIY